MNEGIITQDHLQGELSEVLLSPKSGNNDNSSSNHNKGMGRKSKEDITVFKSLGLAIEDLASALHVYKKAKELGQGTWLDW